MQENTLFNDKTIKRLTSDTNLTAKQKKASQEWLSLMEKGELMKEKQGYLKFYDIILKDLLGYDNIKHEKEGVEFTYEKDKKSIVRIEAKGMSTKDLFLPQKRAREESPVQQLWRYMGLHATPYGIVTNYKEFILFKYDVGSTKYYLFDFEDIKKSPDKLQEFVAIFSKENIDKGFVEDLYKKSVIEEREFTKEFYKLYHETRLMLIKEFETNSKINRLASVHFAQMFLNRLMFVFFAEDTGKIDKRTIEERLLKTLDNVHLFSSNSSQISNILVGLFTDLDKGSDFPVKLFGFNGELFKSPIPPRIHFLDFRDDKFFKEVYQYSKLKSKKLKLNEKEIEIFEKYKNKINPIIKNVLLMASFDFNTEVNVNILGHIFEQSISDIEDLKTENTSRRKKEGIFYTPEYITDYICRNTIIPYLSKKGANDVSDLIKEYADNIEELEKKFKEIKILDPACGSGAFLIKATDIMLEIFKAIQEFKQQEGEYSQSEKGKKIKKKSKEQLVLFKWNEEEESREIIENSIYGVDINEESVGITKLSLFLKMARKNRKLTNLSDNIKQGNSLIDDPSVAGDLAFDWDKEFPFKFDVVIGNPPYVNIANISDNNVRRYFQSIYKTVKNKSDLYSIFTEKATGLLRENGLLSFIFSNSWLGTDSFSKFRQFLIEDICVLKLVELPAGVFEGAIVTAVIIVLSNSESNKNHKIELFKFSENNFNRIKHKLSYERIKKSESLTFSFEPEISFKADTTKLDKIAKFSLGIKTSNDKRFILDEKKDSDCYPVLRGKDIQRYYPGIPKKWIWYKPRLMMEKVGAGPRHLEYFLTKEKILFQGISGGDIKATLDPEQHLTNDKIHIIYELNKGFDFRYILGVLNSKFVDGWFKSNFNKVLEVKINQLKQIPIPKISLLDQEPFIEKADLMLNLNKEFYEKKDKFFNRIKKSFNLEKINNKINKFYELEFNDFIREIEKQIKNKISLKEQDEWEDYFNEHKKEVCGLKEQISKTDSEIDQMVYKLYGLTQEEIKVVEKPN
jgi:type I restriction-modification system DNA methylase subunit